MFEQIRTSRSGIGSGTGPGSGTNCRASGRYSAAWGLASTASAYGAIAGGSSCTASGSGAVAFGNSSNVSGVRSFAAGSSCTVSGDGSVAFGTNSSAAGGYSIAVGGSSANGSFSAAFGSSASAGRYGQLSLAAGMFANRGDAQQSRFTLRKETTDATPTEISLDGSSAYLTIAATRTMSGMIRIAAHRTDVSGTAAAWPSIAFGITRDSTGSCRLLGSVTGAGTTTLCDAGGATWSVAVTADSTNNRLAIAVTGEAGKTIRWVASVDLAEVG